jgi:hypothetical protein
VTSFAPYKQSKFFRDIYFLTPPNGAFTGIFGLDILIFESKTQYPKPVEILIECDRSVVKRKAKVGPE